MKNTKWFSKYTNSDGSLNMEYLRKHLPKSIAIELTNFCSHECIHCPKSLGDKYPRKIGYMELSTLKKVVDDFVGLDGEEIYFCQDGDACFAKILVDAVQYIISKDKNMKIIIVTNGVGLTEKLSRELLNINADYKFIFDIYAACPETFNRITQTNLFEQCEKNFKKFMEIMREAKKDYKPIIQILKHPWISKKEFVYFKNKWDELGLIPRVIKLCPYPGMSLSEFGVKVPEGKRFPCNQPFNAINIFYDGNVTVCCLNYGKLYVGNVKNQNIMDIWVGREWNGIREAHLKNELTGLVCEDCNVWYHQGRFFFENWIHFLYCKITRIPVVTSEFLLKRRRYETN